MAFNINVRVKFNSQKRARMGVWEAMEMLNTLVDESDPDVSAPSVSYLFAQYAHDSADKCVADRASPANC